MHILRNLFRRTASDEMAQMFHWDKEDRNYEFCMLDSDDDDVDDDGFDINLTYSKIGSKRSKYYSILLSKS